MSYGGRPTRLRSDPWRVSCVLRAILFWYSEVALASEIEKVLQHHVSLRLLAAAAGVHTTLYVRSHFCLASWGGTRSHGEHVSLQGASHEDEAFQDQGASLDDRSACRKPSAAAGLGVQGATFCKPRAQGAIEAQTSLTSWTRSVEGALEAHARLGSLIYS